MFTFCTTAFAESQSPQGLRVKKVIRQSNKRDVARNMVAFAASNYDRYLGLLAIGCGTMPACCFTAFASRWGRMTSCANGGHCFQNIPSASIKLGESTNARWTEAPAKTLVRYSIALSDHGEEVRPQRLRQDIRERGRRVQLPPRATRLPRGAERFGPR